MRKLRWDLRLAVLKYAHAQPFLVPQQLKGYVFKILGGCDKQARFPNEARSADFWACPPSAPQGQGHSLLPWVWQALSVINSVIVKKGENDLPGLTDTEEPRMRGPKRASKIRKLLNLSMEEDVSKSSGIIALQYADDTIIFSSAKKGHLSNLKCILLWFEKISGMRINFHKSEFIAMNLEDSVSHDISHILGCPLAYSRQNVEKGSRLERKIVILWWEISFDQIMSIKYPVLLSFIKFPKWAIKLLNTQMANCLWNDNDGNKKYHLANWDLVTMCKEFGGLGVQNLRDLNVCLLESWLKRYLEGGDKIWKGLRVKFWEDNWLGSSSLAIQFWPLYVLVNEKSDIVASLWDGERLRSSFRRTLSSEMYLLWEEILQLARTIEFKEEEDSLVWQLSTSGFYSSQTLYKVVNFRGVEVVHVSGLWEIKIPPLIHFFFGMAVLPSQNTQNTGTKTSTLSRFFHGSKEWKQLYACEGKEDEDQEVRQGLGFRPPLPLPLSCTLG
ncbi:hypothetical protein U9M48_036556 [Paspalum notatum var. saurae]|uniref:Reverse transcriptase domain-containing protein n=1 Tax=Paspalum notatum var. saurae TaxID=547442 RepID=A0AAQ3UDS7_PASNO